MYNYGVRHFFFGVLGGSFGRFFDGDVNGWDMVMVFDSKIQTLGEKYAVVVSAPRD